MRTRGARGLPALCLAVMLGFALFHPGAARAGDLCAAHPTDDTLRPLPAALAPQVQAAFGLHDLSRAEIQKLTVMRCMGGQVFVCFEGANLPCGKANSARSLPAAKDWCQHNPQADFIPAYITGHDSLYQWRCKAGQAVPESPAATDARGFLSRYWRPLN
ncbi:hypothetical protein [Acidocella sp.]|uniref:hypothetical protein n=1 Tax=Acidocella sp. TaxID=50710 RepID=UPI0026097AEB|nr:hypothetical protein [Acidocella sp.]